MGWSVGYDDTWDRDIGYGIPAYCDHKGCDKEIDRGLSYVCCGSEPYGGENGCGRFFCHEHESYDYETDDGEPFCTHADKDYISPEHPRWIKWKLNDPSWRKWRIENPVKVRNLEDIRIEVFTENNRPNAGG